MTPTRQSRSSLVINRIITLILLALLALGARAQTLTTQQLATVCAACKADPTCAAPRAVGDTVAVISWLNAQRAPIAMAWHRQAPTSTVEEAPTYTAYDSLIAGKRDSWVLFLRAPRDFARAKTRNWVVDVWGTASATSNAEAVLQAGTFGASNAQYALGGTLRTTGTVSALDLTYPYALTQDDANYVADPARCQ